MSKQVLERSAESVDFVLFNYLYFKVLSRVIAKRLIIVDNIINANVNIKKIFIFLESCGKTIVLKIHKL